MSETTTSTVTIPEPTATSKFNLRSKPARVALLTVTAVTGAAVVYFLSKKDNEEAGEETVLSEVVTD